MFGPTDRKLYLAYHQRPKELVVSSMHKQCLVSAAAAHAADLIRPTQIGKCAALDRGYTNIYGRSAL